MARYLQRAGCFDRCLFVVDLIRFDECVFPLAWIDAIMGNSVHDVQTNGPTQIATNTLMVLRVRLRI